MSYWYEPKLEDIDLTEDGDEMHIYLKSDEHGAIYCSLKVEDVREILNYANPVEEVTDKVN